MGASEKSFHQNASYSKVTCIGTGFSGIGLGATLQRWYCITDIQFFDRSSSSAGTWTNNTYPGCACDIPGALYSYSYEQNPGWSRLLPAQTELKAYLDGVAAKYKLPPRMHFNTEVEKCVWCEKNSLWTIYLRENLTGLRRLHQSKVIFHCGGGLVKPRSLIAPGVENFKGPIFHCAKWDQSFGLEGKRVIVIGNGCTGVQVVPALIKECKVASLTHIVRSKHWLFPALDFHYTPRMNWGFRNIPGALALHRYQIHKSTEAMFSSLRMDDEGSKSRAERRNLSIDYVKKMAPKEYHDKLIPDYEVGCRRRVFDHNYLTVLNQPNVNLTDSPIARLVPEGIITEDGQLIEADAIILANGFDMTNTVAPLEVFGENSKEINEHWNELGGGSAYNTVAMADFPNYFVLSGPNTGFGHTSTIFAIECGTNLALRVLKPVLEGKAASVVPSMQAEVEWTNKMQASLKNMVWLRGGCSSWYVSGEWCSTMWPYTLKEMWRLSFFPTWSHWQYKKANGKSYRYYGLDRYWKPAVASTVLLGAAAYWFLG